MRSAPAAGGTTIDAAAFDDALALAAARCGRLSNEQVGALRRRRRRALVAAPVAALALLTGIGVARRGLGSAEPHQRRLLVTRAGSHGAVTLADGSTVRLDGATRLLIDYDAKRRVARLEAGQAFFDVRHNPTQPFVVQAGETQVRVLGTAFDVDRTRGQVALSVYRGAVGFDAMGRPGGVIVRAGYRSRVRGGAVEAPARFDPSLPDWRHGWIDTTGMRLDDLVDVLGRAGGTTIVRPTGTLASIRVAGRFRTDRPATLLAAIGEGFGFAVVPERDGLTLQPRR